MDKDKLWVPHRRETWPWRVGKLLRNVEFTSWNGPGRNPEYTKRDVPIGTPVKIVMVSRFGDVGITDDISKDYGYHARVSFDDIEPVRS